MGVCTINRLCVCYNNSGSTCDILRSDRLRATTPAQNRYIRLISQYHLGRRGAGRSSEVERSLMVRWVVGSILHGEDPLSYFSFQPVLQVWCNKGCGMLYCLWDGAYKRTLAVNKSSLCGGSGFPFSLSE